MKITSVMEIKNWFEWNQSTLGTEKAIDVFQKDIVKNAWTQLRFIKLREGFIR